jgi:ppGpp synthetase/RelA/SpoT-type nucleotidyltranferase
MAMKPKLKNEILVSFYQSKEKYERLAHEIRRLFKTDLDFPEDSVYTIKHRIKDEERLIEKIDEENKKRKSTSLIDSKNYQDKINDILGMRVVCFRRSDVEKIEKYFQSLKEEKN